MRVKITNDTGHPHDTKVMDLDTGQVLAATRVEIDVSGEALRVTLTVPKVQVAVTTDHVTVHEADEPTEMPADEV